ncbi:MAG TPA: phytanoyl-CoA dioxygenase family protein [Capsulimonadaceae bacterium]
MVLTEEQIEHYYREGYVVIPGLVPETEVDAVLAAFPSGNTGGSGWSATVFDHANPLIDQPIHRLLVEPHVVGAARDIFESEPRVYYGMLALVPANGGNGLPWHQDNQYTHILFSALNVFIALGDITPDKAGLWIAPRTHRAGVQASKQNTDTAPGHREAAVEPENGEPLGPMRKGDVAVFDRSTYHRSLRNNTDTPRYAYAAQFQSDTARQAIDGKKDPTRMRAIELAKTWSDAGLT